MTESCPDCGRVLMTEDDGFVCLGCQQEFDTDEITTSPLYVTDSFGDVRMDVPDPRRGHDEQQLSFSLDKAECLVEALEDAIERAREDKHE